MHNGVNCYFNSVTKKIILISYCLDFWHFQEDSVDMQARDNDGFVDVFLGDEGEKAANNNYFMPVTTL